MSVQRDGESQRADVFRVVTRLPSPSTTTPGHSSGATPLPDSEIAVSEMKSMKPMAVPSPPHRDRSEEALEAAPLLGMNRVDRSYLERRRRGIGRHVGRRWGMGRS